MQSCTQSNRNMCTRENMVYSRCRYGNETSVRAAKQESQQVEMSVTKAPTKTTTKTWCAFFFIYMQAAE